MGTKEIIFEKKRVSYHTLALGLGGESKLPRSEDKRVSLR
jgi:hypothetical protein